MNRCATSLAPNGKSIRKSNAAHIVCLFRFHHCCNGSDAGRRADDHRRCRIAFLSGTCFAGLFNRTVSLCAMYATASHSSRPRSFKICSCFSRWFCSVASTINPSATILYSHCIRAADRYLWCLLPSHHSCSSSVLQAIKPRPTITGAEKSLFTRSLKKLLLMPG